MSTSAHAHPASHAPPALVLLATDLGARCDRALDRAAQLARAWRGGLIAVNVLDPTATPGQMLAFAAGADDAQLLRLARRQLERDLAGLAVQASARVARGADIAEVIARLAVEDDAGLVVTAVARDELFGRHLLGSTVERLARMLTVPLLVVRTRPHRRYRRIVVATDLADAAVAALQRAARWFAQAELVLLHVHEAPHGGLGEPRPAPADVVARCAQTVAAAALPPATPAQPVVLTGTVTTVLAGYCHDHEVDLAIIGGGGRRGALAGMLLGSTAARLLPLLPCDTMVVRDG